MARPYTARAGDEKHGRERLGGNPARWRCLGDRDRLRRMESLVLYGTVTSPYVRRVRMLAMELSIGVELIDTSTDSGQARLRALSPLWKVPAAQIGGRTLLDSASINRHLLSAHGPGPLAPNDPSDLETEKRCLVIDGALDALINAFYLAKDGVTDTDSAYVKKQRARAEACLGWLEERVEGAFVGATHAFGLPEIHLLTALEWMLFRDAYPVRRHARLSSFLGEHAQRPSARETAPPS
jgi:glutathione S-transferase